jgi:hypothetical protein
LGGAVLVVDLSLLGWGCATPRSCARRGAEPWLIGGIAVMLPTGLLLFASEAIKCYDHEAFWVKMTALAFALLFTFTIRRTTIMTEGPIGPLRRRLVALSSLALWLAAGLGSRNGLVTAITPPKFHPTREDTGGVNRSPNVKRMLYKSPARILRWQIKVITYKELRC